MEALRVPLAILVLLVAGGVIWACAGDDDPDPDPPEQPPGERRAGACPPPGPAVVERETGRLLCGAAARRYTRRLSAPARELYALEPDEKQAVRQTIARSRTLRAVLGATPYKTERFGSWTATGGRRLGAVTQIALARPIDAVANLPYVCGGDLRKGSGRVRTEMYGVTRFHVLVDLRARRIARVTPVREPGEPRPVVTRPRQPEC